MTDARGVDTSREAVERVAGHKRLPIDAAALLRALLAERDRAILERGAARAQLTDALAENDAARFERNNLAASLDAARAEVERLRRALEWYAARVAGCRVVLSGGEEDRAALMADGGKRARAALEPPRD